ncbi:hypothetical protein C2857_005599 [Epichloe festucae Fl1]|uniref:Uncharacterized protein n=1 Tax=Epichloe festucae (strain Fl1) TaxID=877507 RepID=A0A7S9KL26_EPIFF|nr:hypothetical protein C2857_005599 [Epichloe festucae Fl1]
MACIESSRAAIPSLATPEPVEKRATSQLPTPTASPSTSQLPNPTASPGTSQLPTPSASPSSSPAEDEGDKSEEEEEEEDDEDDDGPVVLQNMARCPRCLRLFPKGSMADHRKTHLLSRVGTEGQLVSRSSACSHCRRRGHRCIVAKRPNHEALRTVRCLQCLVDREGCSFEKAYRHLDVRTLSEHPAARLR